MLVLNYVFFKKNYFIIIFFSLVLLFIPPTVFAASETGIIMWNDQVASSIFWRTVISDNSFGSENEITSPTGTNFWIDCEASPTNSSRILCGANEQITGEMLLFSYNNATGTVTELTSPSSDVIGTGTKTKLFDIEFDSDGDAFLVYIESSPDDVKYRIMLDSDDDWGNETTFKSTTDWDNGYWISAHRDPSTDDIMVVFESDTSDGANLSTALWNGASVGSTTDHGQTSLSVEIKLTQDVDFAWEGDRGEGVLVWSDCDDTPTCSAIDDDLNDILYRTWTGGSWDSILVYEADVGNNGKQASVQLATEYSGTHDKIGMCFTPGNTKFIFCDIWDNTSWLGQHDPTIAAETGKGGESNSNLEWQTFGDYDLYVAASGKTDVDITFFVYDESADSWGSTQDLTSDANQKGTIQIMTSPRSNAVMITNEDGKNLDNEYALICDGTSACDTAANWESVVALSSTAVTAVNMVHDGAFLVEEVDTGHDPIIATDVFTFVETTNEILGFVEIGTDTFTFVETFNQVNNYVRGITDTFTFVETGSEIQGFTGSGTDVFTFVETTNEVFSQVRSATDTLSFVETHDVFGMFVQTGTDTFTFVETTDQSKTFAPVVLTDVWSFIETTNEIIGYARTATDTFVFVETFEANAGETRDETDTFAFVETTDLLIHYERIGSDTFAFVEMTDVTGMFERPGSDTFAFVETIDTAKTYAPIITTDTFTFVETSDVTAMLSRTATDTFTFVETSNLLSTFIRNGTDTFVFIETFNALSPRNVNEIFTFTESVQVVPPFVPGGQYIWFWINEPTESTLGGIYAATCPGGFYVSGISTTGTLICTSLP